LWRVANKVQAQKIAVGHNADDQVETLLMHFLRGSGLAGLRGMTPIMAISLLHLHPNDLPSTSSLLMTPHLIRPLLGTPRRQIEAYCRENQLLPRLDSSNLDTTLFRNRLRHELIPYLESYNPNIRQVLHHTAQVVAAEVDQLNDLATQAWSEVVLTQSNHMIQFHRERWLKLSLALRRSTLRRAVYTLHRHLRDISFEQIEQACKIITKGEVGSQATLPQGLSLVLGYDTFIIAPKDGLIVAASYANPRLATGQTISVTIPGVTSLPSTDWQLRASLIPISQLNLAALKQTGQWEAFLDADTVGTQLNLRPRQPGDTFSPLGLAGHRQKVNEFMINAKIPAQQRNHIPLLVAAGQIIWVCGYRLDERACLNPSSQWVLHLKFEQ
jgi:tRNA(Ile)-lysidine synthetase-like protein